ncbi:Alpha/beta hydrolase family protein [Caballeronia hypogeia]|uniref:Alpha/beta hydrolase family protein n=1 Tax=Caballeronia hypogeia TaxID=1777140 RepID=A0A157ZW01_9BURK|nr:hypothetical protein [Caballeronia hypogeia]SAK49680.1 Alpha/beta hydrolase family protein [Caballeronia hypogeia]
MKRRVMVALLVCALGVSLGLSGCGGGGSVQGSAVPVPGTDLPPPSPALDTGGSKTPSSSRFVSVAPATSDAAKYAISLAIQYDLGTVVTSSSDSASFSDDKGNPVVVTPTAYAFAVRGWLRYPVAAATADARTDRYPVVLFLHGNHEPTDPSYQGYDYLARDLAQQGYVVLSLDAGKISGVGMGDMSSQTRAQLLLGTLDRMRQIDANGGPGVLSALRGKLDFDRVGIMGHSRGGQGVSYAIKYNLTRKGVSVEELMRAIVAKPSDFSDYPDLVAAVGDGSKINNDGFTAAITKYNIFFAAGAETAPPYNIRAGIMVGTTDSNQNVGVSNVPLAVLVPSCDGDVSMLSGAQAFDRNRIGTQYDAAPRFQVVVNGANHNYFNTVWVKDDMATNPVLNANFKSYCSVRDGGPRLSADDQRRAGTFLINSFMRYFVGSETKFADYWNGLAQLPSAACPAGSSVCDERALLTIQKPASDSKMLQRFQDMNAWSSNLLGGAFFVTGFDQMAACAIPYSPRPWFFPLCMPDTPAEFTMQDHLDPAGRAPAGGGYLSVADALRLTWTQPNAKISTDLKGVSAAAYDSLTFRVAVVRPMGQEVVVTLTDTKGKSASLNASDFSDALYLAPKPKGDGRPLVDDPQDEPFSSKGAPAQLLNMVSLPFAAFKGVDKSSLAKVEFALPKASGSIVFTDLEFQNFGRPQ